MAKVLSCNVVVDEVWYGPAYGNADQVPDDVAAQLGDHVWEPDAEAPAAPAPDDEAPDGDAAGEPAPSRRKPRRAAADED